MPFSFLVDFDMSQLSVISEIGVVCGYKSIVGIKTSVIYEI